MIAVDYKSFEVIFFLSEFKITGSKTAKRHTKLIYE